MPFSWKFINERRICTAHTNDVQRYSIRPRIEAWTWFFCNTTLIEFSLVWRKDCDGRSIIHYTHNPMTFSINVDANINNISLLVKIAQQSKPQSLENWNSSRIDRPKGTFYTLHNIRNRRRKAAGNLRWRLFRIMITGSMHEEINIKAAVSRTVLIKLVSFLRPLP